MHATLQASHTPSHAPCRQCVAEHVHIPQEGKPHHIHTTVEYNCETQIGMLHPQLLLLSCIEGLGLDCIVERAVFCVSCLERAALVV